MTFAKGLTASGIVASFSAKGTPHDNAAKESFFATLEKEHLRSRTFETHAQARASIFRYIEGWYNPLCRRRHNGFYADVLVMPMSGQIALWVLAIVGLRSA